MLSEIVRQLRPTILSILVLTLVTGLAYPLAVTAVAQVVFPKQANGSMIQAEKDGKPMGSTLIGQPFSDPKYFWGRLTATTGVNNKPYDPTASTGSNLGPTNPGLMDNVNARIKDLKDADPDNAAPIPVDLVTSSGSGLDPEISPAAAEYQLKRVAKARKLDVSKVRDLVAQNTQQRQLGVFGEARVNVLSLNLALDAVPEGIELSPPMVVPDAQPSRVEPPTFSLPMPTIPVVPSGTPVPTIVPPPMVK